jgi:hypothetical protein
MKTDYEKTGKVYSAIEAFTRGNCSQAMPDPKKWYYFGTTHQFKTCKDFTAYLSARHIGHSFKTNKVKP